MKKTLFAFGAAIGLIASGPALAQTPAQTLKAVKDRGILHCGVSTGLAGFAIADQQGNWDGLDVDFCRALSAAIFNDPQKVKLVPLNATVRFDALKSGDVDLLSRNTTWTHSRDTSQGLNFATINFFDGQGFIVHKKLNVKSAKELAGATVCTQQGTTTELNLADYFRANNMKYEPVVFQTNDEVVKAYEAGRCDSMTTDMSGLYAERLRFAKPDEHVVLPDIISKEPLGAAVRHGDDQWFDLVKWTHFAMLTAEELGVTKANVDEMTKSTNPELKRLLGTEGKFGEAMGVTNDWAVRIVKHVGNYGESYERNVGMGSRLKIARGQNALWTKGGLQYAPPIR